MDGGRYQAWSLISKKWIRGPRVGISVVVAGGLVDVVVLAVGLDHVK